MEIKGVITGIGTRNIACCKSITDINIDEKSLFDELDALFNLDPETDNNRIVKRGLRYVILDKVPTEETSLDSLAGDIIVKNMVGAKHEGVCYSEYTCGYGGFDYVLENGHSLFDELSQYKGKYIHLSI